MESTISRHGREVVAVFRPGREFSGDGITCDNPEAPLADRVCRKIFRRKPIYMAGQYDEAVSKHLDQTPGLSVVLSMNGYSNLTPGWLATYQIKPGAYEAACGALLRNAIRHLRKKFQVLHVQTTHGASAMGVDVVIEKVSREFGITPLGFSCPEFMPYVPDDDTPVYVAETKQGYADLYIRSLDMLITTGGRLNALQHDTLAACIYDKRVHFVDLPNMLSPVGVPPRIVNPDGSVVIENAAAAFGRNISSSSAQKRSSRGDSWDELVAEVNGIAVETARKALSPDYMFKSV